MTELIRRGNQGELVPQVMTAWRRLPYEARQRVLDEFAEGYASVTRIQVAGWAGSVGIHQISQVAALEAQQAAASPLRADLYDGVVEDVALVVRHAVRRLGSRP